MSKQVALDFTGVESREVLPVGEYAVEVVNIDQREGNKGPYLNWELKVVTGPFMGKKLWNITSLSPKSLWVLRANLEALGMKVASGRMNLNPDSLKGLKMGVRVEHKTFDGKTKAKVSDVFPLNELGDPSSEVEVAEETTDDDEDKADDT